MKFEQKEYKTRHDWVGKVIHTNKWYMHNPAPVLENATHKLLWDFDIHESPNLDQKTRPKNNQQKIENI